MNRTSLDGLTKALTEVRTRRGTLRLGVAAALAAGLRAAPAVAGSRPASVTLVAPAMNGNKQVDDRGNPNQGDPDGVGRATFTVDTRTGKICIKARARNIGTVTEVHIHEGKAGQNGEVFVDFGNRLRGCAAERSKLKARALAADPKNYYANIHTDEFDGAIRDQLRQD